MMLAQSIDGLPADTLKNFLWAGAALLVIAYYAKALFWGDAKTPQPFEVRATAQSNAEMQRDLKAMNHRLISLENWRAQLMSKLDADKMQVIEAGNDRARSIYAHVEEVRRELDEKISRVPNETVALLKNTGAI